MVSFEGKDFNTIELQAQWASPRAGPAPAVSANSTKKNTVAVIIFANLCMPSSVVSIHPGKFVRERGIVPGSGNKSNSRVDGKPAKTVAVNERRLTVRLHI